MTSPGAEEREPVANDPFSYDRSNPSPRFAALLALYREMHRNGDASAGRLAGDTFDGRSLAPHTATILDLIRRHEAKTLLDYGAGKGVMYGMRDLRTPDGGTVADMRTYWGLDVITLYDPAYVPHSTYPTGRFDAVISTDVLEHVPAEDIPWVAGELMGFAERFVFVTIAGYAAEKQLPNGENAHCTVRPADWWVEQLNAARARAGRPEVRWYALYLEKDLGRKSLRTTPLKG
jgi:hypothetical protein